jgi:heme/copper-type cytochrome/quinol oxidase subunit 2
MANQHPYFHQFPSSGYSLMQPSPPHNPYAYQPVQEPPGGFSAAPKDEPDPVVVEELKRVTTIPPPVQYRRKSSHKWCYIILVAIILAGGLAMGLYFGVFKKMDDKEEDGSSYETSKTSSSHNAISVTLLHSLTIYQASAVAVPTVNVHTNTGTGLRGATTLVPTPTSAVWAPTITAGWVITPVVITAPTTLQIVAPSAAGIDGQWIPDVNAKVKAVAGPVTSSGVYAGGFKDGKG